MADWQPTGQDDQALKDAMTSLPAAVTKAVPNVDKPEVKSRFVLESAGYFDLRAYVMSGKDFPRTESQFSERIPANAFTEISTFDKDVYAQTTKTMVGIGSSCSEYYDNELAKLINAASSAIQYADNTTSLLTQEEGINLRHHLDVLLQEKYKTKADQDSNFQESREAALMTLAMLKDDADSKKKEVDLIIAKLITMRTTTLALLPTVATLTKKFKTGPVENSSTDPNKKKPYIQQLNAKYSAKIDEIEQKLIAATKTHSDWEQKTAEAVGFAFWPGIGWIVMSIKAAQAAALKKAYNELMEQIAEGQKENAETLRVVNNVNTMINQCNDIDGKMSAAITAMSELSLLFGNHSTCYEKISFFLNGTSIGVKSDSANNRKTFVKFNLDKTVGWLADLKSTALEFQRSIIREVKIV